MARFFCYPKTHIILPLFLQKDVDVEKYIILIAESVYCVTLGFVFCVDTFVKK